MASTVTPTMWNEIDAIRAGLAQRHQDFTARWISDLDETGSIPAALADLDRWYRDCLVPDAAVAAFRAILEG